VESYEHVVLSIGPNADLSICDNFLYGFKGAPAARQAVRPQPDWDAEARGHRAIARADAGTEPVAGRVGGRGADSGRAACRALPGGSPLGATPPLGQHARTRGQAVPTATREPMHRDRGNWLDRPPRADILSPRKDHRLGRASGTSFGWRKRHPRH
jgi:hypothetical protein